MNIRHDRLKQLVELVFSTAGCNSAECERVAQHLIESNLVGHDSHGVIRVSQYVRFIRTGTLLPNQVGQIAYENDVMAVIDGQFGFGQVIGEQAMRIGIEKSGRHGIAMIAVRNAGHLGRIGHYAQMAAESGLVSLNFVNSTGYAVLVAPFGGIDRRLSSNPLAAGIPVPGAEPIILDFATAAIAEGKLKVARNRGESVMPDCIIDASGNPTTDPSVFYADPPGAILPFGGHKGYGLSLLIELLAGAITGSGCSNPANSAKFINGMLAIIIDPARCSTSDIFTNEILRFIEFLKSSRRATPAGVILLPGELEHQTKVRRLSEGIEVDSTTWQQLMETCHSLGISDDEIERITTPMGIQLVT